MSQGVSGNPAPQATGLPMEGASHTEFTSLRGEIVTRVIFQNVLLCLTWCSFGLILTMAVLWHRPELLPLQSILGLSASAMWAHHGARTAQIRMYLTSTLEPALNNSATWPANGWEHALARMRFQSLLGSRWFVSTKGFFLGSQLLIVVLLVAIDPLTWFDLVSLGALAGTIWALHDPPLRVLEEDVPAEESRTTST